MSAVDLLEPREDSIRAGTANRVRERLSILIATRNRGTSVMRTLSSAMAMDPPADEIILVDQSDGEDTRTAVEHLLGTGRFRYVKQQQVGLSRARNLAIQQSRGDLLAFTDDDCEVPADFARQVADGFGRWPGVGLLFGNVRPGPHDQSLGLIPSCERRDDVIARGPREQILLGGMGACMAGRRQVLLRLHGFDPWLGAGTGLFAGEETDLTLRALEAGVPVAESAAVQIIHHGFRPWSEVELLADHYLLGTGAVYAKHWRLRPMSTSELLVRVCSRWLRGRTRLHYTRQPRRLALLTSFGQGFARGLRMPLDPLSGQFLAM